MRVREPNRRLLAVRQAVVRPPQAPSQLRHRFRPQRHRRPRRALLRRVGPRRRRPSQPETRHPPARRDPGPPPLDRVQARHGHNLKARTHHEQLQDHRRPRRERPHRLWCVHHHTVRHQRDHPWVAYS